MPAPKSQQLSLGALIALVVGSMIGSGIFAVPSAFARSSGAAGAFVAWTIAGFGMLMLAFVFQTLSRRRPDLDTGIYAYAREGFGSYLGFASAVGYWIGCCLADVACLVLIKATLGQFFPVFGDGTTAVAIVSASILLWGVHLLVLRGVKQAAALNTIATIAKIVPIVVFIVVAIVGFRADVFALNFWGGEAASLSGVASQVRSTMLVTVFVFVGVEGASVYSRYARRREDVGVATVLGFLGVLSLLVLVTILSYGVLPRPELAALPTPALAGVMAALVGPWGLVFISVGLLISILGNYLSWSLLAAEVLHSAARNQTMPAFLARENANEAPAAALWLTNIVIQVLLLVTWFAEYAFTLALKMTSAMTLIPYLLVAAYGLKLAWTGETYDADPRSAQSVDRVRGAIATAYAMGMLYAGGLKFLLLSAVLYAPGTVLYFLVRREQKARIFTPPEMFVFAALVLAAIAALFALASGAITV
ncbi:arginine:ornithine antiporter / lysine permease [Variovorax sp. HW608]|uniref:basic amino acid/polyamine antiporter n=1 Tax=Variovorax sp. HW608 TaxID=1034889 RepID=UPI00081FAF49|nr:basic amino acid/polyamine antiporter [Variovorax sp. HW608]SCK61705.1 arginine:ornithine antiporter / lysine permease [Variovorax sp. HW608]